MKKYLINLFRVINSNVGDSTLVYISNDHIDFEHALEHMEDFFKQSGTYIKTSIYHDVEDMKAYIEYSFTKENKQ